MMACTGLPKSILGKRKFPDDTTRDVFEAAKTGNAALLAEILKRMNDGERTTALEAKEAHDGFQFTLGFRQKGVPLGWQGRAGVVTNGVSTPLIVAAGYGNLDCVKVLLQYKANIESQGHVSTYGGNTHSTFPSVVASANGHVDVLNCLVANGADVNACTEGKCTPLMIASLNGHRDAVSFLAEHGADISLQDKNGDTALHYAIRHKDDTVRLVSCLIDSGADVNVLSNNNRTPLMLASSKGHVKVVTVLTECGANLDLQDKDGNTAFHFAVSANSLDVAHELLCSKAAQLYNSQGLTPLLSASNKCNVSMVKYIIKRKECSKEQRIEALELLGASVATQQQFGDEGFPGEAFEFIRCAMEERFEDPVHPLTKAQMEPVEAYQNRRESQTPEELAQISGDTNAVLMESLIIRERILGQENMALIDPIQNVAYAKEIAGDFDFCIALHKHAMEIEQSCDKLQTGSLKKFISVFNGMVRRNIPPRQEDILYVIGRTMFEYERQMEKLQIAETEGEAQAATQQQNFHLVSFLWMLLKILVNLNEQDKNLCVSMLLQKLLRLNPRDDHGNTLLHVAVEGTIAVPRTGLAGLKLFRPGRQPFIDPCPKTTKMLLNAGFNVNAINDAGETPLHRAVTFQPNHDKIHLLAEIMQLLFDRGAHHDFVNSGGKTAMNLAQSDEACRILAEKECLQLKCISARAVKKSRLAYLGIVPKELEEYISLH